MGINNLWLLLAPVGRQIEIETLASKVLAVDASIWLTQFIKAMRDDEGKMIKNAHLIGTFHRVAKLLFYRIKPVFVFDGQTPELKKKTIARRRQRHDHQAANLRQTAQRILINHLKLQREKLKKTKGKAVPAVDPNFILPEDIAVSPDSYETKVKEAAIEKPCEKHSNERNKAEMHDEETTHEFVHSAAVASQEVIDLIDDDEDFAITTVTTTSSNSNRAIVIDDEEDEDVEEEEREDLCGEDVDFETDDVNKIDIDAVFAMPGHLQKDMIQRILRDHRQQARETFIPLAGNPEEYSRAQINSFLKTSKLNRRIEKAKRKLAGVNEEQGKRVASEADRMFILSNEKERRKHKGFLGGRYCPSSSEEDEEKEETKNKDIDDIFKDGGGKSLSQEECDSTAINTVTGESVRTPLLDRWRQKRQLVDDSAVSSIKDFTRRLETSGQQLKISYHTSYNANNSNANTSAASPMLAIERARRRRLELEIATTSQVRNEDQKDTIEISFQASDAIEDSSYQHLFPASMFDQKKNVKQEQVTPKKEEVVEVEEEDEDIEWEPAEVVVKESETTMMNFSSVEQEEETKAKPAIEVIQIDQEEKEEDDVKWEEAQAKEEEEFQPKFEEKKELIELEDEEDEEETYDNDDMYLMNLKNELEEEKAEEDLKLLKEEALQSAIATASNLTQWAAGAVRKALEAHTQKATTATSISNTATASSSEINQVVLEVQDSPERDERKVVEEKYPVSLSKGVSDLIQVAENEEETDEYLEAMIARSLEDSISPSTSTLHAPRYLHYTTATATAASTSKSSALLEDDQVSEENVAMLEQERELLKKTKQRQMRDVEGFTDEMVQEVMALLRLFGVPFLVCPMEAEAQCAALEQLGLVDGIITDDSDIFAFGGQHVYKNIFHHQKFVEAFYAQDIEKELGFTQQEMISLALLLGSDYTDGIRGIGIVNATEIVNAFPGRDGLKEFKEWVHSFNLSTADEILGGSKRKERLAQIPLQDKKARFKVTHSNARRKWELGEAFPNNQVIKAYEAPQVDRSSAKFSWALPDLQALRNFCSNMFGWEKQKTDGTLLPLMEKLNSRTIQTRIDSFFTSYQDNIKYAKIQSKRLRLAVQEMTNGDVEPQEKKQDEMVKGPAAIGSRQKITLPSRKKKIFKKSAKSLSSLSMRDHGSTTMKKQKKKKK